MLSCSRRLEQAGVDEQTTQAIVDVNEQARVDALRATLRPPRTVRADRVVLHEADPDGATDGTAIGCSQCVTFERTLMSPSLRT